VAASTAGRYSIDIHLRHDPSATEAFARTHVRRLEAMRRFNGSVAREPDGTWIIAGDHLERAADYERQRVRERPVAVDVLSRLSLEAQVEYEGPTWLDRELLAEEPEPLREGGFGRAVREAGQLRQRWLIEQELASEKAGGITYRAALTETLRRRELARVAGEVSADLGKAYKPVQAGERISGTLLRAIETGGERLALIERARDFTLVPWRPVLDRQVGKNVSGIMREQGISWTIGRSRGGPGIV
jgi:hypothetical protein